MTRESPPCQACITEPPATLSRELADLLAFLGQPDLLGETDRHLLDLIGRDR